MPNPDHTVFPLAYNARAIRMLEKIVDLLNRKPTFTTGEIRRWLNIEMPGDVAEPALRAGLLFLYLTGVVRIWGISETRRFDQNFSLNTDNITWELVTFELIHVSPDSTKPNVTVKPAITLSPGDVLATADLLLVDRVNEIPSGIEVVGHPSGDKSRTRTLVYRSAEHVRVVVKP